MLFNSEAYLLLLLVAVLAYWLSPRLVLRQLIVLAASLYFYASWSIPFTLMLVALIAVHWVVGFMVQARPPQRWIVAICMLDLGVLAYFKYSGFLAENIGALLAAFGQEGAWSPLQHVLPLGISFYMFELISYTVDVARKRIAHERNPLAFAIFVLFFPHLIAGPICRGGQFLPQVNRLQRFDGRQCYNGLYLFACGLALKCGLADGLAPFVNVIYAHPADYSGMDNAMATLGFGVQILGDFWGYSLMALGSSLLFGYVLPANFNAPYAARSIQEFWRRWHITLSNWLRDYLYFTLGGSQEARRWKIYRNLGITMLLGGLWHGASWNFIIWGGIHGAALAAHRAWRDAGTRLGLPGRFAAVPIVGWGMTMLVVFAAWVFFRAPDLAAALTVFDRMASWQPGWLDTRLAAAFYELLLWYVPLQWLIHRTTWQADMAAQPWYRQVAAIALLTGFCAVYYTDGSAFIYFQF